MRGRRGPKIGYDHGIKRQYRREVWATFKRYCPVPMADAKVLLMPSREGDEIHVALSSGIRLQNVTICDHNPAIVATLKRELKKRDPRYARMTSWGMKVERGLLERTVGFDFHLINLDLCGRGDGVVAAGIAALYALAPHGLMALTWSKGRDAELTKRLIPTKGIDRHEWINRRLNDAANQLGDDECILDLERLRIGQYRLHRQPIQFAIWRLGALFHDADPVVVRALKALRRAGVIGLDFEARQCPMLARKLEPLFDRKESSC